MTTKEKVLDSIKPVLKDSVFVSVNKARVAVFAEKLESQEVPVWENGVDIGGTREGIMHHYFFLDSINFCFWAPKGKKRWSYYKDGEWLTGYFAFGYAIKHAFESDTRFFDSSYLAQISFKDFSHIFEGKNELLLMPERHQIIQENFSILNEKYGGKVSTLVQKAEGDANAIVELLLADFPSFRDIARYDNQDVYFLKRAQLFVYDIFQAFQSKGLGYFTNLDDLAISVDYKIPQILEAEGVLQYNTDLVERIKNEELIPANSKEELEIRAQTMYACELLGDELRASGRNVNSRDIDWLLWVAAKKTTFDLPYHKTITTFY